MAKKSEAGQLDCDVLLKLSEQGIAVEVVASEQGTQSNGRPVSRVLPLDEDLAAHLQRILAQIYRTSLPRRSWKEAYIRHM